MTSAQIMLVKNSWKVLRNVDAGLIGDLFYSKLFKENPKLKKMFPASMAQQQKKLIDMLGYIISRLHKPEIITDEIKEMALRHQGYGVKREHYKMVGEALIWTMQRGIGNEWTDEVKEAWLACYNMIAETMFSSIKGEVA